MEQHILERIILQWTTWFKEICWLNGKPIGCFHCGSNVILNLFEFSSFWWEYIKYTNIFLFVYHSFLVILRTVFTVFLPWNFNWNTFAGKLEMYIDLCMVMFWSNHIDVIAYKYVRNLSLRMLDIEPVLKLDLNCHIDALVQKIKTKK